MYNSQKRWIINLYENRTYEPESNSPEILHDVEEPYKNVNIMEKEFRILMINIRKIESGCWRAKKKKTEGNNNSISESINFKE